MRVALKALPAFAESFPKVRLISLGLPRGIPCLHRGGDANGFSCVRVQDSDLLYYSLCGIAPPNVTCDGTPIAVGSTPAPPCPPPPPPHGAGRDRGKNTSLTVPVATGVAVVVLVLAAAALMVWQQRRRRAVTLPVYAALDNAALVNADEENDDDDDDDAMVA